MAPKVDVPYLWIWPLCLVSLDLAYGLLYSIMDRINCWKKKTFYCNDNKITEFEIIDSKNSSNAFVLLYELIDS